MDLKKFRFFVDFAFFAITCLVKGIIPEQRGAIFASQKLGVTHEKTAEIAECSQATFSRVLESNNQ
jgi:hypothetical protein